jgi:ubiquinone/menaquinone biosynthesis C-methylase UbiE
MSHSLREVEQRNWYTANAGADRNDLRANRGVLFQTLATERSFIRAFSQITEPASTLKVLDIGCGSGAGWYQLFRLGVKPNNMTGIEIQSERLDHVADLYPQATAVLGDASCIPLADGSFDLVYESTLFATLTDDHLRKDIASEMIRVCKSSGYLLLIDWRIQKFWDPNFGVLNKRELKRLFGVFQTRVHHTWFAHSASWPSAIQICVAIVFSCRVAMPSPGWASCIPASKTI